MPTVNCSISNKAKKILSENTWMKPSVLLEEAIRQKALEIGEEKFRED